MEGNKKESVQAIPKDQPNRTLWVRFKAAKPSTNAKAPIARAAVELDGVFAGTFLDVPIFRAKDGNGVSVMIPGGSFPAVAPKNMIVTNGAGQEFETTATDPIGDAVLSQLPKLIVDAYGKWIVSHVPKHQITFAP